MTRDPQPMPYRVWWRCYWHALRDVQHGQNSLSALEHATGGGRTFRARMCRRALHVKASQGHRWPVRDSFRRVSDAPATPRRTR